MRKIFSIILFVLSFSISYSYTKYQTGTAVSFDGTSIAYATEGEGEIAIVFVHGWSCDLMYWENQIDHLMLNNKYQIVAIDLAGHGDSGKERVNYTIESFAKDVEAVVNELQLQKVILAGHSMGGAVILEASRLLKGKLLGLLCVDTAHDLGAKYTEEQRQQYIAPLKENFKENTNHFVRSMFPGTADPKLVEEIAADMSSAPEKIAISAMENLTLYEGTETLHELDAPIIAINADLWPTNVEGNQKLVKSFELKLMKGYGHFLMKENPVLFNQLMDEAITELTN
ncbi:MAG: alpha/beta hydrolase [bacterium]